MRQNINILNRKCLTDTPHETLAIGIKHWGLGG